MKFMLLCYDDEQAWQRAGEPALRAAMQEAVELCHGQDAVVLHWFAAALLDAGRTKEAVETQRLALLLLTCSWAWMRHPWARLTGHRKGGSQTHFRSAHRLGVTAPTDQHRHVAPL